jgi:hypothetical protein
LSVPVQASAEPGTGDSTSADGEAGSNVGVDVGSVGVPVGTSVAEASAVAVAIGVEAAGALDSPPAGVLGVAAPSHAATIAAKPRARTMR